MLLPTPIEIGHALAVLGTWRVLHAQEACYPYAPIPASVVLALGYRESGLRNVCGGATWDEATKSWRQSYTDRGVFQISDTIDRNAKWLRLQEGCAEGSWWPADPPVEALTPRHCPRFSPALDFTKASMIADYHFAKQEGVPTADCLRFAVAAHNAGATGALEGWRDGDVDKFTAHGDYSAYVLGLQPSIHDWIVAHPHWQYHPATPTAAAVSEALTRL